jgi:4-hydroxybenzoate polyprenyltransferase
MALFALLRPRQWIKNGFVCTGVIFGGRVGDPQSIQAMLLAVMSFCAMGSCVYVINDYRDRESDRQHPTKRNRPLASGAVSTRAAVAAGAAMAILSVTAAWFADARVLFVILLYLAINAAYSFGLKNLPVIDVFCIAIGFMLRIMAGTWAISIPPSGWLILTGMFSTLFLGFAKRLAEWTSAAGSHDRRRVLTEYSPELLNGFLSITATGTVLSYGLYTLDSKTIELHHTDKLIFTLPFVLFGLFRYLYVLHRLRRGENPTVDVFTDYQNILCGCAFVGSTFWLLHR